MSDQRSFPVTMMRAGRGLPIFEIDAYRYTAEWLPAVGDLITITRATGGGEYSEPESTVAYVTRVEPASDTPIRVMEAKGAASAVPDDIIVAA
jgi:hypothetical protein